MKPTTLRRPRRAANRRLPLSILSNYVKKVDGRGGARPGSGRKPGIQVQGSLSPKRRPQHHLIAPRRRPRGKLSAVEAQQLREQTLWGELYDTRQQRDKLAEALVRFECLHVTIAVSVIVVVTVLCLEPWCLQMLAGLQVAARGDTDRAQRQVSALQQQATTAVAKQKGIGSFVAHTTAGQPGSPGYRHAVARNARALEMLWQAFPDEQMCVDAIRFSVRNWDKLTTGLEQVSFTGLQPAIAHHIASIISMTG